MGNSSSRWIVPTVIIAAILLVVGGLYMLLRVDPNDPRTIFASCLTEKGTKMFGAYWCPHCLEQKKLFGRGFKRVKYVECGVPGNTAGVSQACKDAGIKSYPTWEFADGTRETGEQSFADLAEKTGCTVPVTP